MPIEVGDPVIFHGDKGRVCCVNTFESRACVQFEGGDCLCVPRQSLHRAPSTTAKCTTKCAKKCSGQQFEP